MRRVGLLAPALLTLPACLEDRTFSGPGQILASAYDLTIVEGDEFTVTISLDRPPGEAVEIQFIETSGLDLVYVEPDPIVLDDETFEIGRDVVFHTTDDGDVNDLDVSVHAATASSFDPALFEVMVTDDDDEPDFGEIIVSTTELELIEGGDAVMLEISLDRPPRAEIVVSTASPASDVLSVYEAQLYFNDDNFDIPQVTIVAAADDPDADDEQPDLRTTAVDSELVPYRLVDYVVTVTDDD